MTTVGCVGAWVRGCMGAWVRVRVCMCPGVEFVIFVNASWLGGAPHFPKPSGQNHNCRLAVVIAVVIIIIVIRITVIIEVMILIVTLKR